MHSSIRGYFLFDSIGNVLKCEKLCIENSIKCQLRPVPRNLSSECGICLLTNVSFAEQLKVIMTKNGLKYRELCFQ